MKGHALTLTNAERCERARQLAAMRRQVLVDLRESAPRALAEVELNARQEVRTHADQAEAEREDDIRLAEIEANHLRLLDFEEAQTRLAAGLKSLGIASAQTRADALEAPGVSLAVFPRGTLRSFRGLRAGPCVSAAEP